VAYNFKPENNKKKLLTKYENVTERILLREEPLLHNAKKLQHARF
jgi:hypothetical protein